MDSIAFLNILNEFRSKNSTESLINEGNKGLLFDVYKKALGDSVVKEENAKVLVDNLDIVLKMSSDSLLWTEYDCIYSVPYFYEKLEQYVMYFPNKELLPKLIQFVCINSNSNTIFRYTDLIEYVLINSDVSYLGGGFMNYMDTDMKLIFLDSVLKTRVPFDFWFVNFNMHLDIKDYVIKHIDEFLNIAPNLFSLRTFVEDDKYALERVNNYFNNHHRQVLNSIFYIAEFSSNNSDVNNLIELVELIVDDIMKNENANYSDINFEAGTYSIVLFGKNKVLKIGTGRRTERFPNNPYIIKPLLRRKFVIGELEAFLEVIEVERRKSVSRGELYNLYASIRDLGLIWTDVKPSNVGELIKDNIVHWRFPLELSDETLTLDKARGEGIELKKGELVLLDADFIFDENDPIFNEDGNDLVLPIIVNDFENEYQKNKKLNLK